MPVTIALVCNPIPRYLTDGSYTKKAVKEVVRLYRQAQQTNKYQPYISYLEGLSVYQGPHQAKLKEYINELCFG